MLSILVPTYNHEEFIVEALDSIRMQKTSYSYEVLVGEDASTDNTKKVLKDYEKKHPGFIQVFYRENNMMRMPIWNSLDLRHRAKGKYLITLEGDDFWTDENKIEKQISFLENHPEAIAVAHRCIVVGKNSMPNGEEYPECRNEVYTVKDFKKSVLPGQLATIMVRNYYQDNICDYSILEKKLSPGDTLLAYVLVNHGKVYCLDEIMSAYRHVTNGGSSYSANVKYIYKKEENWWRELMIYASKVPSIEGYHYIQYKYLLVILRGLRDKDINYREFFSLFSKIEHKIPACILLIKQTVLKL